MTNEYQRLVKLYNVVDANAKDGTFEGSKTRLYEETRLSMKHYPRLWKLLEEMGCIQQLQRGTAQSPTIIKVVHPPTPQDFERVDGSVVGLTPPDSLDTLRKKVATLEERIPPINLARTLVSLDDRIAQIEDHLKLGR